MSVALSGPDPFGFFELAIAAIVLIAAWIILASSRFIQGGVVERPERVPQLYGYTVCLVGLLWALASVVSLVDGALTLSAPAYHNANQFGIEPTISSFEAFRLTYDRARRFGAAEPGSTKLDTLSEAQLRQRFAVYRDDRIAATRVEAEESMLKAAVSLVLAVGVFVFHWRWLRRRTFGDANNASTGSPATP